MQKPIFTAILEDGKPFIGGTSYFDTKWKSIDKKIKRLFYLLPTGDYICISGYDKYYHYVEVLQDLSGQDKGKVKFQFACVLGQKDGTVTKYTIDLKDKKNVEFKTINIESEEVTKLNPIGWR